MVHHIFSIFLPQFHKIPSLLCRWHHRLAPLSLRHRPTSDTRWTPQVAGGSHTNGVVLVVPPKPWRTRTPQFLRSMPHDQTPVPVRSFLSAPLPLFIWCCRRRAREKTTTTTTTYEERRLTHQCGVEGWHALQRLLLHNHPIPCALSRFIVNETQNRFGFFSGCKSRISFH